MAVFTEILILLYYFSDKKKRVNLLFYNMTVADLSEAGYTETDSTGTCEVYPLYGY